MSASTTHAPSRNLDEATSIATTPVVAAPMPLITALRRQPRSVARCVYQRRTMPAWLSVKAMKNADRVERDERADAAAETDYQGTGHQREHHDARC